VATLWKLKLWATSLWWGKEPPQPVAPEILSIDVATIDPEWLDARSIFPELNDALAITSCWGDTKTVVPVWTDTAMVTACWGDARVATVDWNDAEAVSTCWGDSRVVAIDWNDGESINPQWLDSSIRPDAWIDTEIIDPEWEDIEKIALPRYTMTAFNNSLRPIVRGDTRKIERTFTGLPTGETIDKAWLTVKTTTSASDPGLFQVEITTTLSSGGQITDASSSDGQIGMYFIINGTQSGSATGGAEYVYDIQVRSAGTGAIHTLVMGTVTFVDGVTAATS